MQEVDFGLSEYTYRPGHIAILGGGPAGLIAGFYARKYGLSFTVHEGKERTGGNSVTMKHGNFLFDSGPHLLQTKDVEVTNEIRNLLSGELLKVFLPRQTYLNGKLIDFPFSPLNMLSGMGVPFMMKATIEPLVQRTRRVETQNLEAFAINKYGNSIARSLVLNYSEKLWGKPCSKLSPKLAGEHLRGLNLPTLFAELYGGRQKKIEHIVGSVYYPKTGFGTIAQKFAEACGHQNIRTQSKVTSLFHEAHRIRSIELNGEERVSAEEVLSTLPLNLLVQLMRPKAPDNILRIAASMSFRSLVLVVLFISKRSVTATASIYFPDPHVPFTRLHEPKNRSEYMAPEDETALVVEIPCQEGDEVWNSEDHFLAQLVKSSLLSMGWISDGDVFDALVVRLNDCYPILDTDYEWKMERILTYLDTFSNLKVTGRTGTFAYISLHHILKSSKKIMTRYLESRAD